MTGEDWDAIALIDATKKYGRHQEKSEGHIAVDLYVLGADSPYNPTKKELVVESKKNLLEQYEEEELKIGGIAVYESQPVMNERRHSVLGKSTLSL